MPFTDPQGVPASTYRLQLRKEFPFAEASRVLPHLHALGISHCYCSPILMSAPGSTHGYDVSDYHRIDTELGGHKGYAEFVAQARALGMGILLDFVPNHMGIQGTSNRWWQDVLECGLASPHADFFDIDWGEDEQMGPARILVPILDTHYGVVLEAGRFAIRHDGAKGTFATHYEDLRFPLRPETYAEILAAAAARDGLAVEARTALEEIAAGFRALTRGPDGAIERRIRDELKRKLAETSRARADVTDAITAELAAINGVGGEPRSMDRLDGILGGQHYRLAHWKTGAHEVNYRRFFAIDTLIGLRMENPKVFEETHGLIGGLLRAGLANGLRIDHIDGLRNPLEYLERLQALALPEGAAAANPLYVVVEKILGEHEELDGAWPTHGTTGYEFIPQLSQIFVDPGAEQKLTRLYTEFTGRHETFGDVVYANKRHVLEEMFANAVTHLGHQLAELVTADRRWRDLTRHELVVAIREIMAGLRVYRIYRRMNAQCRPEDTREIERACTEALRRNTSRDAQPFEFVRDLLIGRYPPPSASAAFRRSLWKWVLTFQQYTGAVMAKSVEDTAFYVYNRFVALNEVGGHPAVFGGTPTDFHAANARRRDTAPHCMLATSTHDTKFGEDVRARLYVLSEIPDEWADWVAEWSALNARHKTNVDDRMAPDANEEYRLYQTLIGCWPMEPFEPDDTFRQRIREHVRKAVNEAKVNTHWQHPNERWLEACDRFVDAVLTPASGRSFLASIKPKAQRLARLGLTNSLAQVALKITSPGVPDFYQGTEGWNLTLVDPDNRQLIDWSPAEGALAAVRGANWRQLLRGWKEGGIKLRLTQDLLRFRRERLEVFQRGDYEPIAATGQFAERVVAFRRKLGNEAVLAIVPRLTSSLGAPPLGLVWEDTALPLPAAKHGWRDVLTGDEWAAGESIAVGELFRTLPLAVLHARAG
ncbi:MAG: malto-oligosyltrehalose synthase [Verrucomicrobiota bacterium]